MVRSLFQLGMYLGLAPRKAHEEISSSGLGSDGLRSSGLRSAKRAKLQAPICEPQDMPCDYLVKRNGRYVAGTHLIVDVWDACHLDEIDHIRQTMIEAADAAKATLLHLHLHYFTPNSGVSGVAVLAESHISIHTWPEHAYAALDIFMCGDTQPEITVPIWQRSLCAGGLHVDIICRGEIQKRLSDR